MFTMQLHRLFRTPTSWGSVLHAPADVTSMNSLLKEDYTSDVIMNSLQDENPALDMMTTEFVDESWQGKYKYIPKRIGRNYSMGSIPGRGLIPKAGNQKWEESKVGIRNVYGRVGFDRQIMLASRNNKGAYKRVMATEMDLLVKDLSFFRNRVAWGWGAGILARVMGPQTVTNGGTLEVQDPGGVVGTFNGNRFLHGDAVDGHLVAVLDGASPTTIKGIFRVGGVNPDGTDVTTITTAPFAVADDDLIVLAQSATQTSYQLEPEGFLSMVDDGTYVSNYHDISRVTYGQERSHVITGVGPLSLDAIQQGLDMRAVRIGGDGGDLFVSYFDERRAYLSLLETDRRYTGADLKSPDGGTVAAKQGGKKNKKITFGDIPWLAERDAPYGMLFNLVKDTFVRYFEENGGWADEGGDVLKWVDGYDEWTAYFYIYENPHCFSPARNIRWEGINADRIAVHAL